VIRVRLFPWLYKFKNNLNAELAKYKTWEEFKPFKNKSLNSDFLYKLFEKAKYPERTGEV